MVICLERDADLHTAQLISLPLTVSCFSKIQIGFTFLVPAYPGSPGKGPSNVCVCNSVRNAPIWIISGTQNPEKIWHKHHHHKKVKVAHTRLPSEGFRSWSRCLAVSLQVMWVINQAAGCQHFPPGLQLPPKPLRRLLPILLLGEQRRNGCEQFA